MKILYRLYRRGSRFYCEHTETGKQQSLRTESKAEALRIVAAKNEAAQPALLNLQVGSVYLSAYDPELTLRTWGDVMELMLRSRQNKPGPLAPSTIERCKRAYEQAGLKELRSKKLVETKKSDLLLILSSGKISTAHYLARLHNLAFRMDWLPRPILKSSDWLRPRKGGRRSIKDEEHSRIIKAERNEERRRYYEILWETGASQSDAASFTAQNIDRSRGVLSYKRLKTGEEAEIVMGPKLIRMISALPEDGPLFPTISKLSASDRASEFWRRCDQLGISGVSLHSYRYSWAERAKALNVPQREAQKALGHCNSRVHLAYAKGEKDSFCSLDYYEAKACSLGIASDLRGTLEQDLQEPLGDKHPF